MSVFQPLSASIVKTLLPFYHAQSSRLSDFTAGAAFMWRKYLKTAYCIHADMLICRITLKAGDFYTLPIGSGDVQTALTFLENYCREEHLPLQFAGIPQEAVPLLLDRYGTHAQAFAVRDAADYLYDFETFVQFPGRKLSGKRNHLRRFWAQTPTAVFRPLAETDIPQAVAFVRAFGQQRAQAETMTAMETEEIVRCCELLENMQTLGIFAGALYQEDTIIAITAGEIVGDMLCVHIEKADTHYEGVYQAISNAFAAYMQRPTLAYINREDDAGDEGLRRSKLSYRPCALLEKYVITVTKKEG